MFRKISLAGMLLLAFAAPALAQTSPGFVGLTSGGHKYIPTPSQWDGYFSGKQDTIGPSNNVGVRASLGVVGKAANNTELSALASTGGPVIRLGFITPGDSPSLTFIASSSPCGLNSGAGDGGSQVPTIDGKCWLAVFPGRAFASQFGVNTAISDNSSAINSWLALAGPNIELDADAGVYNFTSAIYVPPCPMGCAIVGIGRTNTQWHYTGASTSLNLFTFGNGSTTSVNVLFSNIRVSSSTVLPIGMGSGAAMLFWRMSDSTIEKVTAGNQDLESTRSLNNGIVFAGVHSVHLTGYQVWANFDGLQVFANSGLNSDLWATDGLIYFNGHNGIHVAGGVGGIYLDQSNAFANGVCNVLIDDAIVGSGNQQVFFGPTFSNDGNWVTPNGVCINETASGAGNMMIGIAGYIGGNLLHGVDNIFCPYCRVYIGPASIVDDGTGVFTSDATTLITIGSDAVITGMNTSHGGAGYGVDSSSPTTNIQSFAQMSYNVTDYTANTGWGVQSYSFTPTAWATPGAFAASGSGVYMRLNQHRASVEFSLTISNNGTASGGIHASLPFANMTASSMSCRTNNGYVITGITYAGSSTIDLLYNGAYPGGSYGSILYCNGIIDN